MANDYSAYNPENWMPMVQDFRNFSTVARKIGRFEFRDVIGRDGDTVHWPYDPDVYSQGYTPGTDLTVPSRTGVDESMSITTKRAVVFSDDPISLVQRRDKGLMPRLAKRAGNVLGRYIDQDAIGDGVTYAANNVSESSAVTLSKSNMLDYITKMLASCEEEYGADGEMWCVVDPLRRAVLSQLFTEHGFSEADAALRNGFIGKAAGLNFYVSNDLPTTVTLSAATNPTAGDTITIKGVTFTFRAAGTAAVAGEISLGAAAADTQANIVLAINGTGTPGASTYIELAGRNRAKLTNSRVTCSAFAADVATITAYGRMNASETFTAAGNVFGTETGHILAGRKGSISVGVQKEPTLYEGKEAKRPEVNYIIYQLHGKKVFYEDTFRLAKLNITM